MLLMLKLLPLLLFVLVGQRVLAADRPAEAEPGAADDATTRLTQTVAKAMAGPDSGDVRVLIDGKPVSHQEEYSLERDMSYSLKVENLKPGSEVVVRIKFAGVIGLKTERRQVPETGEHFQLFDTPDRKTSASCVVSYTTADGLAREQQFRLEVR